MTGLFISAMLPPDSLALPALWFIFCDQKLLLIKNNTVLSVPELQDINLLNTDNNMQIITRHYLGVWQQQHCYCAEIKLTHNPVQSDFIWQPLKQAAAECLTPELFYLGARALQVLEWDKNHQFCSRCKAILKNSESERVKICAHCQLFFYPRISPCIMVLIKRGKEILLARSPHFIPAMYSALAGFIEPGETVEHAVEREVMEEVGLKIKNLQYQFSQPWPFPDSLMLAFTADYAAGEIIIDGNEIEDAGWFTREDMPPLPSSISIARKLIDLFINNGKEL